MNKEEIWSKTRHFKVESNIGSLDLIDTDVYLDLLNKYDDLQHQLEEKDKVINEILNNPFFTNECPYSLIGYEFIHELCDCDNCEEDYKKCWLKYFENKVLERGKNGKNKCFKRN